MRSWTLGLCAIAYLNGAAGVRAESPPPAKCATIDAPRAIGGTFLRSVNNRGEVLGSYIDIRLTTNYFQMSYGFYKTFDFPHAGFSTTSAAAWNNQGKIVGSYYDRKGGFHGFLLDRGLTIPMDYPGAADTYALSINDKDQIAGVYTDSQGKRHLYLWKAGKYMSIDPKGVRDLHMLGVAINNLGHIAATYRDSDGEHTYLSINGGRSMLRTSGAQTHFIVTGLNDRDDIVGNCLGEAPQSPAPCYLWRRGVFQRLTVSGSRGPVLAQSINNQRQIAGFYFDRGGMAHGFLMTP